MMRGLRQALLALCLVGASAHAETPSAATPAEPAARWSGIDESVIEKVAAEAGRAPRPLWFEMEGDLALFLFLCAGIVGGSVFGYYYRMLFVERIDEKPSHAKSPAA
jgi:ABC-type cobalt transport system substrate-binding protein